MRASVKTRSGHAPLRIQKSEPRRPAPPSLRHPPRHGGPGAPDPAMRQPQLLLGVQGQLQAALLADVAEEELRVVDVAGHPHCIRLGCGLGRGGCVGGCVCVRVCVLVGWVGGLVDGWLWWWERGGGGNEGAPSSCGVSEGGSKRPKAGGAPTHPASQRPGPQTAPKSRPAAACR